MVDFADVIIIYNMYSYHSVCKEKQTFWSLVRILIEFSFKIIFFICNYWSYFRFNYYLTNEWQKKLYIHYSNVNSIKNNSSIATILSIIITSIMDSIKLIKFADLSLSFKLCINWIFKRFIGQNECQNWFYYYCTRSPLINNCWPLVKHPSLLWCKPLNRLMIYSKYTAILMILFSKHIQCYLPYK